MKRRQRASGLLFGLMIACGGSSSETPMPFEPVPHSGPEPAMSSQKTTAAQLEDAEESTNDDVPEAATADEGAPETPPLAAPEERLSDNPGEGVADEAQTPTTPNRDE